MQEDFYDFEGCEAVASSSYFLKGNSHSQKRKSLDSSNALSTSSSHDEPEKRKVGRPRKQEADGRPLSVCSSRNGPEDNYPQQILDGTVTSRYSRVIKPTKRFVEDCADVHPSFESEEQEKKRSVGRPRKNPSLSELGFPSEHKPASDITEGDKVCENFSLYADAISSHPTSEIPRVTRQYIQTVDLTSSGEASSAPASDKLQEKDEKLLQSPCGGRSELTSGVPKVCVINKAFACYCKINLCSCFVDAHVRYLLFFTVGNSIISIPSSDYYNLLKYLCLPPSVMGEVYLFSSSPTNFQLW